MDKSQEKLAREKAREAFNAASTTYEGVDAAIDAYKAAQGETDAGKWESPAGWKLVPIILTQEMIEAGHHQIDWHRDEQNTYTSDDPSQTRFLGPNNEILTAGTTCAQDIQDAWCSMLNAAPAIPQSALGLKLSEESKWHKQKQRAFAIWPTHSRRQSACFASSARSLFTPTKALVMEDMHLTGWHFVHFLQIAKCRNGSMLCVACRCCQLSVERSDGDAG